jgi:hypothetical protein
MFKRHAHLRAKIRIRIMSLAGLRLVVTLPPPTFFGGLDRQRAVDHADALRNLGAKVYEFNTEAVYHEDQSAIGRQIEEIRAFNPDAVIGTQHSGYAIQGGMMPTPDPSAHELAQNLFLDVLELPTLLYWDHVIPQSARYLLPSWPSLPNEAQSGVVCRLKKLMAHPCAMHFFPDSGHAAELSKLGIISFDYDPLFVTAVSQVFVQQGMDAETPSTRGQEPAFFGNVYLAAADKVPYGHEPDLAETRRAALAHCMNNWNTPVYEAYTDAIAALDVNKREALRLSPDESFYWRFLYDELSFVANGERRFQILSTCKRPVAFYGGFADPESRATIAGKGWVLRESLPHDHSLAKAYHAVPVAIDVVNAPFINGFSPKLIECFVAGGFMLTTRTKDMHAAFGSLADAFGYSSAEELATKVEYYLTYDAQRRDVTRQMQEIIRRDHTAKALFARTVPEALERLRDRIK